jgi:hypothetical protein
MFDAFLATPFSSSAITNIIKKSLWPQLMYFSYLLNSRALTIKEKAKVPKTQE